MKTPANTRVRAKVGGTRREGQEQEQEHPDTHGKKNGFWREASRAFLSHPSRHCGFARHLRVNEERTRGGKKKRQREEETERRQEAGGETDREEAKIQKK